MSVKSRIKARRKRRADSKKAENEKRRTADEYVREAMQSAKSLQQHTPYLPDQISAANKVYSQGSQEAAAQADPQAMAAQQQALGMQGDIARQGYTAEDAATMQSANRAANLNEQAQRQAVEQSNAMRGMRGGGLQMMGALAAQQGGANRAADQAAQVGQNRIAARQQGVQNLASMGANQAAQSFGMNQARGGAADAFNQAMLQNQQGLQQQDFSNRLAASQNMQGQATSAAGYNQQTADAERERRKSTLNTILNPLGGSS